MSREMQFFMYLIERYAEFVNSTAGDVLTEWDSLNVTKKIYDMYELYHTEAIENAFRDIDRIVNEAKKQKKKNLRKILRFNSFHKLLFYSVNAYLFTVFAHALELNLTVDKSEKSIILTSANVVTGMDVCTSLLYEDVTGKNELTVSALNTKSLGLRVTAVTG